MLDEHDMVRVRPSSNPVCLFTQPVLRNTQIVDTCIVFPQWQYVFPVKLLMNAFQAHTLSIRSNTSFVLSFFAIVALGIFYEWLRAFSKRLDRSIARSLSDGKGKSRVSRSRSSSPVTGARAEEEALLTGSFKAHATCVQLSAFSPCAGDLGRPFYANEL